MKRLLLTLCLLCLPTLAHANLDFYINDISPANPGRYEVGDLVDIQESRGTVAVPNVSPFRIIRVWTSRTKAEVMSYLEPGPSGKRRYYALDETKMSAADLSYWTLNRYIETDETTALGWITRKR